MKPTDFGKYLTDFLSDHLPCRRNASPNTVMSYRDTFALLITYFKDQRGIRPEKLTIADISTDSVTGFLAWLETARGNSISTRNQRLAAIHAFFAYLQIVAPEHIYRSQQILSLRSGKKPLPVVEYLTVDALKSILAQPDTATPSGRRDLALLSLLYDTGARVQELADLKVRDVRLDAPSKVRLCGKGRKSREVPLMGNTVSLLKQYVEEHWQVLSNNPDHPLFYNRHREKLTRAGIAYILKKYCGMSSRNGMGLPEKTTPHVLRHTKAMHLLQAGVNIVYIRDILGHVDIATTQVYARADTEMKRAALNKVDSNIPCAETPSWNKDSELLAWLKNL